MAYYTPDLELIEAMNYIEKLDDSKESNLIRYFIAKKNEHIEFQDKRLKEYEEFFAKLSGFLPNQNPVF